jgi:hypothetical protein
VLAIASAPCWCSVAVVDGLEVPQRVGAAPDVDCVDEVGVSAVAVADQDPGEAVEDFSRVDVRDAAAAGVHRGVLVVAGHVQVGEFPGAPRGGLVHMQEPRSVEDLLDLGHERLQRGRGLAADFDQPTGRAVDAGQVAQQPLGATEGNQIFDDGGTLSGPLTLGRVVNYPYMGEREFVINGPSN